MKASLIDKNCSFVKERSMSIDAHLPIRFASSNSLVSRASSTNLNSTVRTHNDSRVGPVTTKPSGETVMAISGEATRDKEGSNFGPSKTLLVKSKAGIQDRRKASRCFLEPFAYLRFHHGSFSHSGCTREQTKVRFD